MIHYHVTPITPVEVAARVLAGRHALISHAHSGQLETLAPLVSSFILDNGAFTAWRAGKPITDWQPYYDWVEQWRGHAAFDWALIPDVIDGSEADNDQLIQEWPNFCRVGVPVWHMHESLDRLDDLAKSWHRVALGSSGDFSRPGSPNWWVRMGRAMDRICVDGAPPCKLHGLRMLDPNIVVKLPLSSADSATIARNVGLDCKWKGIEPPDKTCRGMVLAARIEAHQSRGFWEPLPEAMQDLLLGDLCGEPAP